MMIGNVFKFVRQGIWASLSGGCYYESRFSNFTNIFHLYAWAFLLCFPFILYLVSSFSTAATCLYVTILGILFTLLKIANHYLHSTFDNGEQLQRQVVDNKDEAKDNEGSNVAISHPVEENTALVSVEENKNKESDVVRTVDELGCSDGPGHMSLWDELVQHDRETEALKSLKRELSAEIKKATVLVHPEPQFVADKKVTASSGDKQQHRQRSKRRRKEALFAVDRCGSVASRSASSGSDFRADSDSDQDRSTSVSSSDDSNQPSTSKGIRDRKTRVGFRNRSRPSRYNGRALAHLLEQPSTSPGSSPELQFHGGDGDRGATPSGVRAEVLYDEGSALRHHELVSQNAPCEPPVDMKDVVVEILQKDIAERDGGDLKVLMEFTKHLKAFAKMTESVRRALCKVMIFASVNAGCTILKDDELLDSWSVIIEGRVGVKSKDGESILGVGDSFGVLPTTQQQSHKGVMTAVADRCQFLLVAQDDYYRIHQHGRDKLHNSSSRKKLRDERRVNKKRLESPAPSQKLEAALCGNAEDSMTSLSSQDIVVTLSDPVEAKSSSEKAEGQPFSKGGGDKAENGKEMLELAMPIRLSSVEREVGPASDSDSRNVDENFRRCLQNFQKIPAHPPKRASSMQMSRSRRVRRRSGRGQRFPSHRSCSTGHYVAPDEAFRLEIEALATSTRHRHPAGEHTDEEMQRHKRRSAPPTQSSVSEPPQTAPGNEKKIHLATTHADTSEGATHSFQDEHGNWMTYTFNSDGLGVATDLTSQEVAPLPTRNRSSRPRSRRRTRDDSSSSQSTRGFNNDDLLHPSQNDRLMAALPSLMRRSASSRFPDHQQLFLDALRRSIDTGQRMPSFPDTSPSSILSQLDMVRRVPSPKVKLFYNLHLFPFKPFTIQYDRLALMDLLDRNMLPLESAASVLLAMVVAALGCLVLRTGLLHDVWIFWFCVVMATSQYSLIKSVQPDSASPTHGHNRMIAYSRPVYFILSTSLLLLFDHLSSTPVLNGIPLYGWTVFNNTGFAVAREFMLVFVLLLPVIFLLGLLPQLNTFTIYLCEQIEIHIFGGVAATSLLAALFSVGRSVLAAAILYGFSYGAMQRQEQSQHILFSSFCGLLVALSYHLSRQTSSPTALWSIVKSRMLPEMSQSSNGDDPAREADCVSSKYVAAALKDRLETDAVLCPIICVLAFALHTSSAFTAFKETFTSILIAVAGVAGLFIHYIFPQLRKDLPWLFFAHPVLKSHEHDHQEVTEPAKLMWFERIYVIAGFLERNILHPLIVMNLLTKEAATMTSLYGTPLGCVMIAVVGLKLLRNAYTVPSMQYLVFVCSYLFVNYDAPEYRQFFLITNFFITILFVKFQELVLKLNFWLVYVGPWQVTWGSAFHAFAQPFAVPHSAFLTAHALFASLVQAPFAPFVGSAVFLSSYIRPLKFWEKNYNTKRIDHSNTRLSTQLERGPHSDDNNLNSIFYEYLTYSLQKSLAGDISLGRWGNVYSGDCFVLASDYLNAMVHIVERGNGLITFQLRGLEFGGTYCQQREVEAINEGVDNNHGCCCCNVRRVRGLLPFNTAFNLRWMAWQVLVHNYVLDGYSITDNNATTMLGVFDLRKILICYLVKSAIYFLIAHDSLEDWLDDSDIRDHTLYYEQPNYADVDPCFAVAIDDDYDTWLFGVTRAKFHRIYGGWIEHCATQRRERNGKVVECGENSKLVTLCFAISVLGRRALGTASNNLSSNLDSFLFGLHALFKGDVRITSPKDEWVFSDMNLLREVVAPGVRTALKLHQDHFTCPDEYEAHDALFSAIQGYTKSMVITHEGDPMWRRAVLSNTPSLLALRRVVSETFVDQYSVITLNHRAIGFTVVKVNRECVRGLWAGQQNELVFLRNRNPERGSIQNAKQVLRNMINSSCDQPIGYPIYVSPLTSSYATTNEQYTSITGRAITFRAVRKKFNDFLAYLQQTCSGSCNSGGGPGNPPPQMPMVRIPPGRTPGSGLVPPQQQSMEGGRQEYSSTRFSLAPTTDDISRHSSLQSSKPVLFRKTESSRSSAAESTRRNDDLHDTVAYNKSGNQSNSNSTQLRSSRGERIVGSARR